MLARPSAMPSLLASPRCVTRESSCTASNNRKSRWASTSISFKFSFVLLMVMMVIGRLVREGPFGVGPVFQSVDADRSLDRHRVRDDAIAIQAGIRAEQNVGAAPVDCAVHHPRLGEILPAIDAVAHRLTGDEQL